MFLDLSMKIYISGMIERPFYFKRLPYLHLTMLIVLHNEPNAVILGESDQAPIAQHAVGNLLKYCCHSNELAMLDY